MRVWYTHKAEKSLESLSRIDQKRIAQKMRFWADQENPLTFAERMTDPADAQYRFRVGKNRILFDVEQGTIVVISIDNRDSAY